MACHPTVPSKRVRQIMETMNHTTMLHYIRDNLPHEEQPRSCVLPEPGMNLELKTWMPHNNYGVIWTERRRQRQKGLKFNRTNLPTSKWFHDDRCDCCKCFAERGGTWRERLSEMFTYGSGMVPEWQTRAAKYRMKLLSLYQDHEEGDEFIKRGNQTYCLHCTAYEIVHD